MQLWQKIREFFKRNNMDENREQDILYPQSKEKITIDALREKLKDIDDVVIKEHTLLNKKAYIIYYKSLIKKEVLQDLVYSPIEASQDQDPYKLVKSGERVQNDDLYTLIYNITKGLTALIFPEEELTFVINTSTPPDRSVSSSENESTVLGPSDSFTENLETNLGLIKKRIASHFLKTKTLILGTETRSNVAVLYMGNIANEENIERVMYRLQNIEFHGFVGLGVLQQMLEDKPYSPFPQYNLTVRPDNVVSALLDGRIIVILNGSPEAAICPTTFFEMFSSTEDFYNRWTSATLLRFLRFVGFFITISLTPTYISALTHHPEVLPPQMLSILFESRRRVPFPPVLEVIFIELVIEILREAGSRMPTKIGQTIGIVGGIVIGTAAVEAGIASNILIVIVAVSALLSFLTPSFLMSNASRFVRYVFIFAAGAYGFFGQMLALAWLMGHLVNLTSLGTPYMTPVYPRKATDLGDSIIRLPIHFFLSRKGASRAKKSLTRPIDEE